MKLVFIASDPTDAQLIKTLLENENIEALIKGEHLWALPGLAMTPGGAPAVWVVDDADEEGARRIIQAARHPIERVGEAWRCAACGYHNKSTAIDCWSCGAKAPEPGGEAAP